MPTLANAVNPLTTAVIVTYHPALDVLGELVERLTNQVDAVLIVDNGSDEDLFAC